MIGNDDLMIKVLVDGSFWVDVLCVDGGSGYVMGVVVMVFVMDIISG